ncbi:MAG: hypothetical protein MR420_03550 [Spirochaetia bacterium]|nr:hypothetical protein [Spirochaetia bacterium]
MKNKKTGFITKFLVLVGSCFLLASFSPSLDGRAVVVDEGVFPQGLFAKTVGYVPGDTICVTNVAGDKNVDILVIGALDPSEGVAIMLSPEAAQVLGIEKDQNNIVKITKRTGQSDRVFGTAVITAQEDDSETEKTEFESEEDSEYTEEDSEAEPDAEADASEETFQENPLSQDELAEEEVLPEEDTDESDKIEEEFAAEDESEESISDDAGYEESDDEEEYLPEEIEQNNQESEPKENDENIDEEVLEEETVENDEEDSVAAEEVEAEELDETEPLPEETDTLPEEEVEAEELDETESLPEETDTLPEEAEEVEAEELDETEPLEEETDTLPEEAVEADPLEETSEEKEIQPEEVAVEETFAELPEIEEETAEDDFEEKEEELGKTIFTIEGEDEEVIELGTTIFEGPVNELDDEELVEEDELEEEEEVEEEYDAIVLIPAESNPPVVEETEETEETEQTSVEPEAEEKAVPEVQIAPAAEVVVEKEKSYEKYMVSDMSCLEKGKYYVQIAALGSDENIMTIINKYADHYPVTIVPAGKNNVKTILIGALTMDEYKVVLERFKSYGYKDAFLRKIK